MFDDFRVDPANSLINKTYYLGLGTTQKLPELNGPFFLLRQKSSPFIHRPSEEPQETQAGTKSLRKGFERGFLLLFLFWDKSQSSG